VVPLEDACWKSAIPELLADPELMEQLHTAGYAHAAAHSWQRTGERLLDIFEEAVGMQR